MSTSRFKKGAMHGIDLAIAKSEPSEYIYDGDDFTQMQITASTGSLGGYIISGDGTQTITQTALLPGICITAGTEGAQVDDAFFMARQTAVGAFDITIESGRRLAYEIRLRLNQAVEIALFIGLAEASLDDDILTDNTGEIASKDVIGFHTLSVAGDVDVDGIVRIEGGDKVIGAESMTETETNLFNTYGFQFDGNKTVEWFLNNESFAKQTIETLKFPTGQSLTPIFVIKGGEAVVKSFKLDYWVCVQDLLSGDRPE